MNVFDDCKCVGQKLLVMKIFGIKGKIGESEETLLIFLSNSTDDPENFSISLLRTHLLF